VHERILSVPMTATPTSQSPGLSRPQSTSPAALAGFPVHLTEFIGRHRELTDVSTLLETTRVLTLTGAGGTGKTRLASEVAGRATSFYRHVWVDLAALTDGDQIPQQITSTLGVAECPGEHPLHCAIQEIGTERVLLVLDNCEHVVAPCAAAVDTLLKACPNLSILATSREALGVASETAWLVPPLVHDEAVRLFVERARAALPTFCLNDATLGSVREICSRLDGIPLAIELAAARARVLSPEQIASRLNDAFRLLSAGSRTALPRHRTLRATMEWSFSLLAAREQVLLRRLAVFAGTFSLEAAEAVCAGDPLDPEDILDGVTALVDKSLVTMTAGDGVARYRMLETVRQYGVERLRDAGELAALEARHAEYFLDVIEAAAPHLFGGEDEPGVLARLGPDNDNLRAAAAWSVRGEGRSRMALRFADTLFWYWYGSTMHFGAGQFREGRRFITEAIARADKEGAEPALRGRALASRGLIGLAQGDYHDASAAFEESLKLLREYGDADSVAFVLSKFAATRMMLGDLDQAWAMLDEAYAYVDPIQPDSILHSFVYSWRGFAARLRGDIATARRMHENNLRVGRNTRHRTSLAHGYAFLAAVEYAAGNCDLAFAHFCEALPYHMELGDGWGLALDIEGLSACAATRGRHADDVSLLDRSTCARRCLLRVSWSRCLKSASIVTATTIATPWKKIFQNSEIRRSVKPLLIVATRSAPNVTPRIVPEPPKTLTPPMTTAVTTSNSKPRPAIASTLAKRAANMNPPRPARVPLIAKAVMTRRPTRMPARRAASGFDPIA